MSNDQLREIAGRFLDDDAADRFVETALRSAFIDSSGKVDEEKVAGHLTAIFAAGKPQQNWGQYSGQPAAGNAGDNGRAALRKRHGVGTDDQPTAAARARPGEAGRAAAARRHGTKGRK